MRYIDSTDSNYQVIYTANAEWHTARPKGFKSALHFRDLVISSSYAFGQEGFEFEGVNASDLSLDDYIFVAIVDGFYAVVVQAGFYQAEQAWINRNNSAEVDEPLPVRDIEEAIASDEFINNWYFKPYQFPTSSFPCQTQKAWDATLCRAHDFLMARDFAGLTKYLARRQDNERLSDLIAELWDCFGTILHFCGVDTSEHCLTD